MKARNLALWVAILLSSSTFSQTSNVWIEKRGDSTVIVMTNTRGQEIASKLIERIEMKDSIELLVEINRFKDSIQVNMQRRIDLLTLTNEQCSDASDLKDGQIANHRKIEGILENEVKTQRRKRWMFAGGGLLGGLLLGILIK